MFQQTTQAAALQAADSTYEIDTTSTGKGAVQTNPTHENLAVQVSLMAAVMEMHGWH
jgi:hypothetical protein